MTSKKRAVVQQMDYKRVRTTFAINNFRQARELQNILLRKYALT